MDKPSGPTEVEAISPEPRPRATRSLWAEVVAFRGMLRYLFCIYFLVIAIGIDAGIAGLSIGIPAFRRQFGFYMNDQVGWVIEAKHQSAWGGAGAGAQTLGALVSGYVADRYGRIWPLRLASIITILSTVMLMAARSIELLIVSKMIMGFGVGFLVTQVAPFLSELSPPRIRGMAVASINVCMVFGQWLASLLIWACTFRFSDVNDNTAWLLLFGLQFIFPTVFLVWSFWLPQSPVYLVQVQDIDGARAAAQRLYGNAIDYNAHVDGIIKEVAAENENESKSISYWEAGKGTNLRRTLIGIMAVVGQVMTGNLFVLTYQNYFYELAGISGSQAITFGNYSVSLAANLCSYFVIDWIGRRPLYTCGSFLLSVANFIVGFMSLVESSSPQVAGSVSVFGMYLWAFVYQLTVGPVAWAVAGEVPSNRLRAKTNSWINVVNSSISFGIGFSIPFLFNPDAADLGLKMGFIFGSLTMVLCIMVFFLLPETKGRTAWELDRMFESKVPARSFAKTKFDDGNMPKSSGGDVEGI